MSAPLVVNTRDGACWTRRTVTEGGIALYAPEAVKTCPEFVMATLEDLAAHGIQDSAYALPMPVGPAPQDVSNRAKVAELIGDAKPASDGLIVQLGESVRDRREHEHPTWEDLYCLNLVSWMGERMGPVLRRLLDAETERAAFRDQRSAVFATNSELLAKVEESGQARLRAENETRTVKRQFAEAAAEVARLVQERGQRMKLEHALRDQIAELEAVQGTVYRASHDSIVMGHYATRQAAYEHCEAHELRDDPVSPMAWNVDEDGVAELVRFRIPRSPGAESPTGFVVTPLEIASEYDAEADE